MKKTYETPVCQAIIASDEDILTASDFTVAEQESDPEKPGGYKDGAIIQW